MLAGVLYFGLVFGTGFILGPQRELWAVPRLGQRIAELSEMPVILVVIILAARWLVQRLALPATLTSRLGMGLIALGFLLVAELMLVLWLRDLSFQKYFIHRDPVAGAVYFMMLGVFALTPLVLARRSAMARRLGRGWGKAGNL